MVVIMVVMMMVLTVCSASIHIPNIPTSSHTRIPTSTHTGAPSGHQICSVTSSPPFLRRVTLRVPAVTRGWRGGGGPV